jgi:hypothetical protein
MILLKTRRVLTYIYGIFGELSNGRNGLLTIDIIIDTAMLSLVIV